jgi:hypothetical protein
MVSVDRPSRDTIPLTKISQKFQVKLKKDKFSEFLVKLLLFMTSGTKMFLFSSETIQPTSNGSTHGTMTLGTAVIHLISTG